MSQLISDLSGLLGEKAVLTGEAVAERNPLAGLSQSHSGLPSAVLRPRTTEDVSTILKLCHQHEQAIVPQGGMTGLVEGTVASSNELALTLERMTDIEEIDPVNRTMTVQAGVPLQAAQEAAEEKGLMLPLDLGARGSATVGGNVSTNAGGNRVIRYGMMRDMVLGLEAVLADGTIVSSLGKMIKNNAGYDLKQLFIGSEGTLGIVTRVVLRLRQLPKSQNTAFVAVDSFEDVTAFLSSIDGKLGGTLSAFEVMWKDFYELVTKAPAENKPPIAYDHPYYILVESLGADQEADAERFEAALAETLEEGLLVDAVIAKSQSERNAMWAMRDDVGQCLQFWPFFAFDVSMGIPDMESYVTDVKQSLHNQWPDHRCVIFGHLGDGNLHVIVGVGDESKEARKSVENIVYAPLRERHGSVSAEHGIGLEKQPYLGWTRSDAEIGLMRTLKAALDPKGILNPGKVITA